jgi:hypothetical protein
MELLVLENILKPSKPKFIPCYNQHLARNVYSRDSVIDRSLVEQSLIDQISLACTNELSNQLTPIVLSGMIFYLTLITAGPVGVGKTVILANLHIKIEKSHPSATIITRFIRSSFDDARQLLESIIDQISPSATTNDYFVNLKSNLPLAMRQSASMSSPLIIILDGVDHIGPEYAGNLLNWIPSRLPPHTCLIISTSTSTMPIASLDWPVILVPLLSPSEVDLYISQESGGANNLFKSVKKVVNYDPLVNSTPMFIELAVRWHVLYTPFAGKRAPSPSSPPKNISDIESMPFSTPDSIEAIVRGIFEVAESEMNRDFVMRALGYVTAARNGLTAVELEAILNCDDAVVGVCMVSILYSY